MRHDRILTTHGGSLPRPPGLTRLLARTSRGEAVDDVELRSIGRMAVFDAVSNQIGAKIDIGNDGEQMRESFFRHVRNRMTGFGGVWKRRAGADLDRYPLFQKAKQEWDSRNTDMVDKTLPPKVIDELKYLGTVGIDEDCGRFRAALDAHPQNFVEPFFTAPSPGIIAAGMLNEHYDSEERYLAAIGAALQSEYHAIHRHGFLLQIDAPDLALERHTSYYDRPLGDFLGFVERVVATINVAIRGIPRERVRMHVCWGNYEGPHDCDVPLGDILPILLKADVGALVLPFANPRHAHEYREFERHRLADDRYLVAGVIDITTNFVEHPEVVAERIERAARSVGDPRRIVAGTDCGFDSTAGRGRVTEDVVWAKLRALVEGARIASSRLFPGGVGNR